MKKILSLVTTIIMIFNCININAAEKPDYEGRIAEDKFVDQIRQEAKHLPHYYIGLNSFNVDIDRNYKISRVNSTNRNVMQPLDHRAAPGVYTYGKNDGNTITITENHVLGEGNFSVFRAGVGGSRPDGLGYDGKILGTGDVATKGELDNPGHNEPIEARALDTDIKKTVYKNDIGALPDAVLDIYFWDWENEYFGYMYNDNLNFPGRYYYEY